MRHYNIILSAHEGAFIACVLTEDMDNLLLADYLTEGYNAILDGANSIGFRFDMEDNTALEIMQTLLVYADRYAGSGEADHAGILVRFATQMLTAWTGKTENDY